MLKRELGQKLVGRRVVSVTVDDCPVDDWCEYFIIELDDGDKVRVDVGETCGEPCLLFKQK